MSQNLAEQIASLKSNVQAQGKAPAEAPVVPIAPKANPTPDRFAQLVAEYKGKGCDDATAKEMAQLKLENEKLKSRPASRLSLKVSEKGALSLYGMGKFPVTLYREQWAKVFAAKDEIEAFIAAHSAELKSKADKE